MKQLQGRRRTVDVLLHMPWTCVCRYLISQHPEVENKILAELADLQLLKTAQNPKPREMTYADLSKLTYLNAVIKVLDCAPSVTMYL